MANTQAQQKYNRENTWPLLLRFNIRTCADLITWLESIENKQGYIKQLIREDMARRAAGTDWRDDLAALIVSAYTVERTEGGTITLTPKK